MDGEKLSIIQSSLENLSLAVDKLIEKNIVVDNRLSVIEGKETVPLDDHQHAAAAGVQPPSPPIRTSGDVESDYLNVKDSVCNVRLPDNLRVKDTRSGIKQKEMVSYNLVSKSARYVETSLKVIANLKDNVSTDQLQDLFTIQVAHLEYLKNQYASIVVRSGDHSERTQRLFAQLQNNSSGLSDSALNNLTRAIQVTGEAEAADRRNHRQFHRGHRGYYAGRFPRQRFGGSRGGAGNDMYQTLARTSVPLGRQEED